MPSKRRLPAAVVLLSGGLDSATTLFIARARGFRCHALLVDYGQRHRRELEAARRVARAAGCPAQVVRLRLPWGGSALTDRRVAVPLGRSTAQMARGIPATYVPARNTLFLSLALGYAETLGATRVFIGANFLDYSGYPDCRPAFYRAFTAVARQGTRTGVEGRAIRIETPLIRLTKTQIIRRGFRLGVPYALTWSCYLGGRRPCGRCDSCRLRAKGFREAGVADPALAA
ncbi:MAG: 7-cyano-7-deazaguanine synthase QueC [Candidatus Omnitrophica bacterium]|nr:7-cyano-7-deazaguanine synthase QueC [Candidatus Omnitrophota bacterium]